MLNKNKVYEVEAKAFPLLKTLMGFNFTPYLSTCHTPKLHSQYNLLLTILLMKGLLSDETNCYR